MIEKYNIFERAFLEINLQTSAVGIYYVFKISMQGEQRYLLRFQIFNARRTALFITFSNFQCNENSYENRKEKRLTKYRNYLDLSVHLIEKGENLSKNNRENIS